MTSDFIKTFMDSTIHVLNIMAFMEATAGKPYFKRGKIALGDVSALIVFSGSMKGSLALSFSESCICRIVSNMLGRKINSINRLAQDTAVEITNMISGDARIQMQYKGFLVTAGIPSGISGKDHEIKHTLRGPSIIIPFNTEFGPFVVDFNVKSLIRE